MKNLNLNFKKLTKMKDDDEKLFFLWKSLKDPKFGNIQNQININSKQVQKQNVINVNLILPTEKYVMIVIITLRKNNLKKRQKYLFFVLIITTSEKLLTFDFFFLSNS